MTITKSDGFDQASCWSKLCFWWIVPTIKAGRFRELSNEDIHPMSKENSCITLENELCEHWKRELRNCKPKLYWAIFNTFKWKYLRVVLLLGFRELICRVGLALCMGGIMQYFESQRTNVFGVYEGILFGVLVIVGSVISQHIYFAAFKLGLQIRVSLTSITYTKCLTLSPDELNLGKIATLISNDVNRFDRLMFSMCYLFVAPAQLIVIFGILWVYLGPSVLAGLTIVLSTILIQMGLGQLYNQIRNKTAQSTEKRLRHIAEVITGIHWIKISNWEKPFCNIIEEARRNELIQLGRRYNLILSNLCFASVSMKLTQFVILFLYLLSALDVSTEQVFVLNTMMMYLSGSISSYFSMAISGFFESLASLQRIGEFLLLPEKADGHTLKYMETSSSSCPALELVNVTSSRPPLPEHVIKDISLRVTMGQLIGIVGPVGSGKTSLLKSILREIRVECGEVNINCRRVAYVSQDPWIFPASVVDNIVFGQPFDEVWFKTVIDACALASDINLMPNRERTYLGDRGVMLSGGQKARINLARAVYAKADLYLLDDPLSGVDINVGKFLVTSCIQGLLKSKAVLMVTHQLHYLEGTKDILVLNNGQIESFLKVNQQIDTEGDIRDDIDLIEDQDIVRNGDKIGHLKNSSDSTQDDGPPIEQKSTSSLNFMLYWKYWTAGGLTWSFCLSLLLILTQCFSSASDYWLRIWTSERHQDKSGVITYLQIIIGFGVAELFRNLVFVKVVCNSSRTLHSRLLQSMLQARVRFFEINTTGRVLNRFVNDMGVLDDFIPGNSMITLTPIFLSLGSMTVIGSIFPLTIVPAFLIMVLFAQARRYYLRTASNLKRLEAASRSPVFGITTSTITGIATIRASNSMEVMKQEHRNLQDQNSAANLTYAGAPRWFAFCVDIALAVYILFVLVNCYVSDIDGGSVGLALTSAIGLTVYGQQCAPNLSELENGMISVERILEYTNVESEELASVSEDPPPDWPKSGRIQFDKCSVGYGTNPPILHSIDLVIGAGEKMGIIGRTGAGKSSLISSLFRLIELNSGSINIDDVDISKIGLRQLRSKMSIIPQNPILFSGTLRQNLDPFGRYSDMKLVETLSQLDFMPRFQGENRQGLDTQISVGGENLSHGERQLLCVARAVVEQRNILVLDEASAHVDGMTDTLMQNILRTVFKDKTTITIAHRLSTVMTNDKVVVLSHGRIVECGHPFHLLQNPHGYLFKLCQRAGPKAFAQFVQAAQSSLSNHT